VAGRRAFCFEGFLPAQARLPPPGPAGAGRGKRRTLVAVRSAAAGWSNCWRTCSICSGQFDRCWLARELTKRHEQQVGPTVGGGLEHFARCPPAAKQPCARRRPCPEAPQWSEPSSGRKLGAAPGSGPQWRDAPASSPPKTGLSRRRIYALSTSHPIAAATTSSPWPLFARPPSSQNPQRANVLSPCCCVCALLAFSSLGGGLVAAADPVPGLAGTSTNGAVLQLGIWRRAAAQPAFGGRARWWLISGGQRHRPG